jgi:hypothetical protein
MHMKKLLTLALALVALASAAIAQEKKIGGKLSNFRGYRYANENYKPKKYTSVFLRTDCKDEETIKEIVSTFAKEGLKLTFEKENKFLNEQEYKEKLISSGYDGCIELKVTGEKTFLTAKDLNIEMKFTDLASKMDAVKYEITMAVSLGKGYGEAGKSYPKFIEKIMDDFRQYF